VKSIDFSKLGTGNVGDFSNLQGSSIDEILSRVPSNATKRDLTPMEGKVQEGFEYKFVQDGQTWKVRVHGPAQSAPVGSNASEGWVVRIQKGKQYMDAEGNFYPRNFDNQNSPYYNPNAINDTHIPIKNP
jgi:hypothetical protein